jgi:hypothetical protein
MSEGSSGHGHGGPEIPARRARASASRFVYVQRVCTAPVAGGRLLLDCSGGASPTGRSLSYLYLRWSGTQAVRTV